MTDPEILQHLLPKITALKPKRLRTAAARLVPRLRWDREKRCIAYRYLRRYAPGPWYLGGHHVGRLNYGPGICFPDRQPPYLDRCPKN